MFVAVDVEQEQRQLEQYAAIANTKILSNQNDLDPKDRAMSEMLGWCRLHGNVVVLHNGDILTSHPTDRVVQNCKIAMANQGLVPRKIYPATSALITLLLENAQDQQVAKENIRTVSTQQQRLRMLVKEALSVEATDIHIEVRESIACIRFRKHGELFLHAEWLPKLAREVASVAFNKETDHAVTHFNPLVPQNASMPLQINEQEVRLRLASLPAHGGFDVVLRILTTAEDELSSLAELGYQTDQIEMLKKAVNMPSGAIIVAGPTGSGKTTTMASCMQMVSQQRKLYTIEDPVEKVVEGATQVPVNTEHYDRSFASMARTVLRMDPNVIVLGEMRDEDTAQVMMRAAITGHLVFSTVHTNSAPGIITRLTDLGIKLHLMASPNVLLCLICQRLAPILCEHCAVPITESESHQAFVYRWRRAFGDYFANLRVRGHYCPHCHGLGISDRKVVAELIWVDEQGRRFIQEGNLLAWEQYLKQQHWRSYHDRLLDLVKQGKVDPLDAEKLMGEIDPKINWKHFDYQQF